MVVGPNTPTIGQPQRREGFVIWQLYPQKREIHLNLREQIGTNRPQLQSYSLIQYPLPISSSVMSA